MEPDDDNGKRRKRGRKKNSNFKPESVGDYPVGYGKPPKHSRIREGECRNKEGRPKGSKNRPRPARLIEKILNDGRRSVKMKDGKRRRTVTRPAAMLRLIGNEGLMGNLRAQRYYLDLQLAAEREQKADSDEAFEAALKYKKYWSEKLAELEDEGYQPRACYPHPDHIHFDFENRAFWIEGPVNDEHAAVANELVKVIEVYEYEVKVLRDDLKEPDANKAVIWDCIDYALDMIELARKGLGHPWTSTMPRSPDFDLLKAYRKKLKK